MKTFAKVAIATLALGGMLQADTILLGVDGGLTIGGARLGFVAGITGGKARSYRAVGSSKCPSAVVVQSNPCAYVPQPCVVVKKPVCDPCAK